MASIKKRPNGRWRARYLDPDGRERARHFETKRDAERWLDTIRGELASGTYTDPSLAKQTFREYAETWRVSQVHRASTADQLERHLRRNVYPVFGDHAIGSIRPTHIQAWVRGLSERLSPATVMVAFRWVSTIFRAAVQDDIIRKSPCVKITMPKPDPSAHQVEPITVEQVRIVADAVPARYRAAVILAAGAGLRQGEVFGLTVDRVDFLRRSVRVDRQLVTLTGSVRLGPPKTNASVRTVPLPHVVVNELAAHLAAFPAESPDGLVFTSDDGSPVARTAFASRVWPPAARAARLRAGTGFHALRHFYASLLIRHGESVKVVQSRLGHASAEETLNTYAHLWPDSEDLTRAAVDSILGAPMSVELASHGPSAD
jgi:integrase